jgi:hypothetical protein
MAVLRKEEMGCPDAQWMRAIYPPSPSLPSHRGLIAPARAGSIAQLLCTTRTPPARGIYTDRFILYYTAYL